MDVNATLLETRWYQAENCLWIFDATGAAAIRKPGIQKVITISILHTVPTLHFSLINKGHRIAIMLPQHSSRNKEKSKDTLRANNPGADITVDQLSVNPAELALGNPLITHIDGILVDPSRQFNSRWFSRDLLPLETTNLEQNAIGLFRHTQATVLSIGGSLRGHVQLEGGTALPWAILSLSLQLHSAVLDGDEEPAQAEPVILVQAQSNQSGDFVLPLNELPAAEFDMPVPTYIAQLYVQRCVIKSGLPDPDDLQNLDLLEIAPAGDDATFVTSMSFLVRPGEHLQLHSHQQTVLLVRPSG